MDNDYKRFLIDQHYAKTGTPAENKSKAEEMVSEYVQNSDKMRKYEERLDELEQAKATYTAQGYTTYVESITKKIERTKDKMELLQGKHRPIRVSRYKLQIIKENRKTFKSLLYELKSTKEQFDIKLSSASSLIGRKMKREFKSKLRENSYSKIMSHITGQAVTVRDLRAKIGMIRTMIGELDNIIQNGIPAVNQNNNNQQQQVNTNVQTPQQQVNTNQNNNVQTPQQSVQNNSNAQPQQSQPQQNNQSQVVQPILQNSSNQQSVQSTQQPVVSQEPVQNNSNVQAQQSQTQQISQTQNLNQPTIILHSNNANTQNSNNSFDPSTISESPEIGSLRTFIQDKFPDKYESLQDFLKQHKSLILCEYWVFNNIDKNDPSFVDLISMLSGKPSDKIDMGYENCVAIQEYCDSVYKDIDLKKLTNPDLANDDNYIKLLEAAKKARDDARNATDQYKRNKIESEINSVYQFNGNSR